MRARRAVEPNLATGALPAVTPLDYIRGNVTPEGNVVELETTEGEMDSRSSISFTNLARTVKVGRVSLSSRVFGVAATTTGELAGDASIPLLVDYAGDSDLLKPYGTATPLARQTYSLALRPDASADLMSLSGVHRIQTKKRKNLRLDRAVSSAMAGMSITSLPNRGHGAIVGIIDSGIDVTHPSIDGRVAAYMDQTVAGSPVWRRGDAPSSAPGDTDGHGTHVASIAAGTGFGPNAGWEGVATDSELVVVKTDMVNTDTALRWIFDEADRAGVPCVVNMSLGSHAGAHDGSDAEEAFHTRVCGPGRLVVVAAGNERDDRLHASAELRPGAVVEWPFTLDQGTQFEPPRALLTAWYHPVDDIDVALVTPWGETIAIALNTEVEGTVPGLVSELLAARRLNQFNQMVQVQVQITFEEPGTKSSLSGWSLNFLANDIAVGRVDGWMMNNGLGTFDGGPHIDRSGTLSLPSTGASCVSVASYISSSSWSADAGPQVDGRVVEERSSPFSSLGPTRDGRHKPDIAAPGQYLTAALAAGSEIASMAIRADTAQRALTIEGTSMAAPVVAGAIAAMLTTEPNLDPAGAQAALAIAARRDAHTGADWSPAYGAGKLNLGAAIDAVSG